MLPQNKDLTAQVVSELQAKGAKNVVAQLQAGTVSFVAPGALAEETIRPYLIRLGRTASEVTMQVALVSVVLQETTRSEEHRVGKECDRTRTTRWSPNTYRKKTI